MKKFVVFTILLAAIVLSAVNPWPSQLRVWNYTGDNVYFRLSYRGEQKYFLTATVAGNTDTRYYSLFEVGRKKYTAEVTACTVTATGTMDLNTNLKLTFVDCDMMRQFYGGYHYGASVQENWNPDYPYRPLAFWGEPGMEKPNFYQHWDTYKELWELVTDADAFHWDWGVEGVWTKDPTGGDDDFAVFVKKHKLGWENWQFKYDLPADYEKTVTFVVIKDECWLGPNHFGVCLGLENPHD